MGNETFMQALAKSVGAAVENEPGNTQLRGMSKSQVVETVRAITGALDTLPVETNLHVLLFGLSYVRNAVIVAMEDNQKYLATNTGGNT